MILGIQQFAATYGCGSYGNGSYTNAACSTTTTGNTASDGTLPATGENIMYGLVGGILLIVIAVALFIGSRRKKRNK